MLIAPSLLSCDFSVFRDEIVRIDKGGADIMHLDVMDGHFVPNLTFGAPVIKKLRGATEKPFDVHLMISEPHRYINDFADAGADIISFHTESDSDIDETLKLIEARGVKPALAIKPGTAPDVVLPYLDRLYMVLVMAVEPGFGGQKYIPASTERIRRLRAEAEKVNPSLQIEVDGGIKTDNVHVVLEAGANLIVAGSAVYGKDVLGQTRAFMELLGK